MKGAQREPWFLAAVKCFLHTEPIPISPADSPTMKLPKIFDIRIVWLSREKKPELGREQLKEKWERICRLTTAIGQLCISAVL